FSKPAAKEPAPSPEGGAAADQPGPPSATTERAPAREVTADPGWGTPAGGPTASYPGTAASPRARRPAAPEPAGPRRWPLVAAAVGGGAVLVVLAGLMAAGAFKVKTKDGTIVVQDLPD